MMKKAFQAHDVANPFGGRGVGVGNVTPHFALMVTNKIEAYPVSVPRLRSDLLIGKQRFFLTLLLIALGRAFALCRGIVISGVVSRYHAPHSLPLFPTYLGDGLFSEEEAPHLLG